MTVRTVPPHVPLGMVFDYDYFETPAGFEFPQQEVAQKLWQEAPPIFYSPLNGGYWVVTRAADIREICRKTDEFSSEPEYNYKRKANPTRHLPAFYDPPELLDARKIVAPLFTPRAVSAMEPVIRNLARNLIEGVVQNGGCEFVHDIAQKYPVTIFMQMADGPLDQVGAMAKMAHRYERASNLEESVAGSMALRECLTEMMRERRERPGSDLISLIVNGTMGGRPLTEEEALGGTVLMFLAGLGTVASMLTFAMRFLAQNPAHYQQLVNDPGLINNAVEELMRISGVVVLERGVRSDTVFQGITMRKYDRVILLSQVAGLDPAEVSDPFHVDFSRANTPHLIFGSGPHRCLGAHLGRLEMRIFLEEWVERISRFGIAPNSPVESIGGMSWSTRALPLEWAVSEAVT
jgi:cytochrome P450